MDGPEETDSSEWNSDSDVPETDLSHRPHWDILSSECLPRDSNNWLRWRLRRPFLNPKKPGDLNVLVKQKALVQAATKENYRKTLQQKLLVNKLATLWVERANALS